MDEAERPDVKETRLAAALALALGLSFLVFRAVILWDELAGQSLLAGGLLLLAASLQDWLLALAFLGVALLVLGRARPAPIWAAGLVVGLALGLLLWGLANIRAVQLLAGPVTVEWVRMSGILDSSYMVGPILEEATPLRLVIAMAVVLAFALLVWLASAVLTPRSDRRPDLVLAVALPTLLAAAAGQVQSPPAGGKVQNAALAFVASVLGSDLPDARQVAMPRGEVEDDRGAASTVSDKEGFAGRQAEAVERPQAPARPLENLVLVVLESTGIRAVTGYPGAIDATPNLDRHAREMGLRISDVYAHAPSSAFSLASIIAGLEPDLRAESMTVDRDDLAIEGLATVMKARVGRAGYFDSSDKRFQNAGGFALRAGYDFVRDLHEWDCATGGVMLADGGGEPMDKAHDQCTFNAAMEWIGSEPGVPFFLTLWTGMAHYPYMPGNQPLAYVEDPSHNDYLNAVRTSDEAFGALVEYLRARNLLETTLIVVVGDHGEAFGEHGQYGHATGLWEENLRVPLVLLNPQLFPEGRWAEHLASLTDIAPTITDLFALPTPESWHGSSLFAEGRPNGVFLFAPWAGLQLGFRQAERKFIYNANTGQTLLYDLAADPTEATDLSGTAPPALADAQASLSRWVKWQTAFRSAVAGPSDDPALAAAAAGTDPEPRREPVLKIAPVILRAAGTMYQTPPRARLYLDGVEVGTVTVTGALSNAENAVPDDVIMSSFADYPVTIPTTDCPRQLEIEFVNDEWAGEGLTGDTDLYIESVSVGDQTYSGRNLRLVDDWVGGDYWGKFRMAKAGRMAVDLAISEDCLGTQLALPRPGGASLGPLRP